MVAEVTNDTKVLMSFGARTGGFEFAMQLRHDIYRKFGVDPAARPGFCYLDGESLRGDPRTTYTYDARSDNNMMANPEWDENYQAAMDNCKTMVLLITREWLVSKWCWRELDMLVGVAERRGDELKTIIVSWPDGETLLKSDGWTERQEPGEARTPRDLDDRLNRLDNVFRLRVAGKPAIVGRITQGGRYMGTNIFAYSCNQTECDLIIHNVNA